MYQQQSSTQRCGSIQQFFVFAMLSTCRLHGAHPACLGACRAMITGHFLISLCTQQKKYQAIKAIACTLLLCPETKGLKFLSFLLFSELNVAVAACMTDRLIDNVLDSLDECHKKLVSQLYCQYQNLCWFSRRCCVVTCIFAVLFTFQEKKNGCRKKYPQKKNRSLCNRIGGQVNICFCGREDGVELSVVSY